MASAMEVQLRLQSAAKPELIRKTAADPSVVKICVHPFFYRQIAEQFPARAEKYKIFERNIVSLFKEPSDFENAIFMLQSSPSPEDAYAMTHRVFVEHGGLFVPKHPVFYSVQGKINQWRYEAENRATHAFEALEAMLLNPDSKIVFVFGLCRSLCVSDARDEISQMLKRAKKEAFIVTNRVVTKDYADFR